jgi:histone acetyltransferase (RNA polymerase elongator complex component)
MPHKHYTIPVFLPELACPFRCIYCDQFNISGKEKIPTPNDVKNIVYEHLASFTENNRTVEIGFFGGNFTGISEQTQIEFLDTAQKFVDKGIISSIRLSTRPDYIDNHVLDVLKRYSVKTIELGAQSMDDEVLKMSGRGHTAKDVIKASDLIISYGFNLGLQMMLGLPGDTLKKAKNTAQAIVDCGAVETRIYPLLVIKGTELENLYLSGDYTPLTLDEAVIWTKEVYKIFESAGVKILRVGLHPSEDLAKGDALVAGPFHQSFKELVLTELWSDELGKLCANKVHEELKIAVPSDQINYAIGYYGKNKKMLLDYYSLVTFLADNELNNREFIVH